MDCTQRRYPTDLGDDQWAAVSAVIPPGKPVGSARITSMRAVVDAIHYRMRSGCPWRMLPRDFPHWRTVYGYYRQWKQDGTLQKIRQALGRSARAKPAVDPYPRARRDELLQF